MRRTLLPALLVILLVGPGWPAPRTKDKAPPATYWPTTVGTTLEYQFGSDSSSQIQVVKSVERVGDVTSVSIHTVGEGGQTRPFTKVEIRKGGLFMMEEGGQTYDPPVCILKFPVKAGERWETTTKRAGLGTIRFVREVGETKTIEVPAGKFEAVRVTSEVTFGGMKPDHTKVFWIAPAVGVVEVEGSRTLTKYTPGK